MTRGAAVLADDLEAASSHVGASHFLAGGFHSGRMQDVVGIHEHHRVVAPVAQDLADCALADLCRSTAAGSHVPRCFYGTAEECLDVCGRKFVTADE